MARPLSVLLLCDDARGHATTLLEHIDAFGRYSRHDVRTYNPRGLARSRLLSLDEFDVVVVHYSLMVTSEAYLPRDFHRKLAAFDGLKVQYIQDDYSQVDRMAAVMRALGIDVLFTLHPQPG